MTDTSSRARRRAADLAATTFDMVVIPVSAGWVANRIGGPVVGAAALLIVFALGAFSDLVRRDHPQARHALAALVRCLPGELGKCRVCGYHRAEHWTRADWCPHTDPYEPELYLPMWLVRS